MPCVIACALMALAPAASALSTYGMAGIAALLILLFVIGVARAARVSGKPVAKFAGLAAAGALVWAALLALVAATGVLARWELRPPPLLFLMVATLDCAGALGFSGLGRLLAQALPLTWLVGFQAFRLPLELVMHHAANEGLMPVQMSFSGYNFDILSGVSALIVALLLALGRAPSWLVFAWNLLGSLLLAAILAIALAATPLIHAFGPGALNTFIAYVPFVWLPGVMVLSALVGHILVWRRLIGVRETVT